MVFEPISTERLVIRRMVPDDWRAFHAFASDPATMTYIPDGVYSEAQAQQFAIDNSGDEAEKLALTLAADGALIGVLPFHPWFAPQTYEIGWILHPAHRGHGYVTEAAKALLHYCFIELKLHRVIATCQPENPASYRIMETLGMRREAWFQQCIARPDGSWWDEYFYAILVEEWYAQHAVDMPPS